MLECERAIRSVGARVLVMLLIFVLLVMRPTAPCAAQLQARPTATPFPTPAAQDYQSLGEMRLPWDRNGANPRYLTDDWADHFSRNGATGLAYDFGRSDSTSAIERYPVLSPCAGYATVHRAAPGPATCNYGNYVVINTGQGWQVRIAHLADGSAIRAEYNGRWIPRGVPIGNVGNTGSSAGCRMANHIHLELLWYNVAPPPLRETPYKTQMPRLPANSRPFGLPRDDLNNPTDWGLLREGNQETYEPVLRVRWPEQSAVIIWRSNPKERASDWQTLFELGTEQWSSLHQFRWEVERADSGEIISSSDWSPLQARGRIPVAVRADILRRGQYKWLAQVRFPDIREGHQNDWFESEWQSGQFTVLDVSHWWDFLRWKLGSILSPFAHAAEPDSEVRDRPPFDLPLAPCPPGCQPGTGEKRLPPGVIQLTPTSIPTPTRVTAAPEEVVRDLFLALDRQDIQGALNTLDPASRVTARVVLDLEQRLLAQSKLDLDFSRLTYTRIELDGDSAVVRVMGSVIVRSTRDSSIHYQSDSYYLDVPLKRLLGRWYVDLDLAKLVSQLRQ